MRWTLRDRRNLIRRVRFLPIEHRVNFHDRPQTAVTVRRFLRTLSASGPRSLATRHAYLIPNLSIRYRMARKVMPRSFAAAVRL